ncbi:MAG: hypothetical protein JWM47_208 [Acidimicrobiales bacterium]|nr:hypothetical protein [Acidimicrobiales bacterium]
MSSNRAVTVLLRSSLVVALLILGLWPAETSQANFADGLSGHCLRDKARKCFADNSLHTVTWNLGPRMREATFATLFGSYDRTVLDVVYIRDHRAHVDVAYMIKKLRDLPGRQVIGKADCRVWRRHRCDHWHVYFDGGQIAGLSQPLLKSLACHETGHTVGLTHGDMDSHGWAANDPRFWCMLYEPYPSGLGEHNVRQINRFYD